jgi:Ca2+-binding RTX toxin-like protein
MTTKTIKKTLLGSGTLVDLLNGEDLVVAKDVTIGSFNPMASTDVAVRGLGGSHIVTVHGSIIGDDYALQLGTMTKQVLNVSASGEVIGNSIAGALLMGTGHLISNAGRIYGGGFCAVGVQELKSDGVSTIVNSGVIEGVKVAVQQAVNSVGTLVITNTGTIHGGEKSFSDGGAKAVEKITNSGVMIGDVSLGWGDDVYDGRNGTIEGDILGLEGNDKLYGGANADTISGHSGNDRLDGGGGADTLFGGDDNDTYVVDNGGDFISEFLASGTDVVRSSITFSLAESGTVKGLFEKLVLTGSAVINGTGNALANAIQGNSADNKLIGGGGDDLLRGGKGKDRLSGGEGDDRFDFNVLGSSHADLIWDMNEKGNDTILLRSAVFLGLTKGTLATSAFKVISDPASPAGVDGSNRILYDKTDGRAYFDRDGAGSTYAPVLFARVDAGLTLGAADFLVY